MLEIVDIQKRGVKVIEKEIAAHDMAILGYRGKPKYIIVEIDSFKKFKIWELQAIFEEARQEIESGSFSKVHDDKTLKKYVENL